MFEIAAWPLSILISFSCIVSTGVMYLDTLDKLFSNLHLIPTHRTLNPYLTHAMKTLQVENRKTNQSLIQNLH
jgi:hypothetical protein